MTREKHIPITCLDCRIKKRTTVHPFEEKEYYCEDCLIRTARTTYNSSSSMKGLVYLVIIFIAGLLIGSWLF